MKKIVIALLGMLALSCADMFGPLDNPNDPFNRSEEPWARGVVNADFTTQFNQAEILNDGSVMVVGLMDAGTADFSDGVSVTSSFSNNYLLMKYSQEGDLIFGKPLVESGNTIWVNSMVYDENDSVYIVGHYFGGGVSEYNFGNGVTLDVVNDLRNPYIVKFDIAGNAQWARGLVSSSNQANAVAEIQDVAIDPVWKPSGSW
jgi:hypothetical protein